MPFEEKEMDEVLEPKEKDFLEKMERGKFYSLDELSEFILGKRLDENTVKSEISGKDLQETIENTVSIMKDLAYLESVIGAHYAVGNLRIAWKNGKQHYSKI